MVQGSSGEYLVGAGSGLADRLPLGRTRRLGTTQKHVRERWDGRGSANHPYALALFEQRDRPVGTGVQVLGNCAIRLLVK